MDIKNNTYQIKALLSSGLLLDLTKSVNGQFEWGEQKGELAQRLWRQLRIRERRSLFTAGPEIAGKRV